jgi:hypothetical protein
MDIEQCFSPTYRAAREKFINAARSRAPILEAHVHPTLKGPAAEELVVDVASLGNPRAEHALMIISGTHGVEGYAGSGCQTYFLKSGLAERTGESSRLIFVHAINPYGFAYSRRVNEDNIDLNRNFVNFSHVLPVNPHYAEYAQRYLPTGATMQDYEAARDRLAHDTAEQGGYQFYKQAMQPGQYESPDGVYYGGAKPAWSNQVFLKICRQAFAGVKRAAVLDIHTGLGPPGVGELIFMTRAGGEQYAHLFTAPVSCAGLQGSVTSSVKGSLITAAEKQIDAEIAVCCVLEFGTVALRENVEAKIFENWTHRYFPPEHPLRVESTQRMRDAYFCDTPAWKGSVIARASEVIEQLHGCLKEK